MKVAILAGGAGTRLAEETSIKPKPMVEIGDRPILWHIMRYYASFGLTDFSVALGYKGEVIKRYFLDYLTLAGSMSLDLSNGQLDRHQASASRGLCISSTPDSGRARARALRGCNLGWEVRRSCSHTATAFVM